MRFSLVKFTTIRSVLSNVTVEDLHMEQLDIKTAFLHGDLEEDIYVAGLQPQRYHARVGAVGLQAKEESL